jgi:mono/diheme cytochrome c family protein
MIRRRLKMRGRQTWTKLLVLLALAVGCFGLARVSAAPQAAPKAKEQEKEDPRRLIYSVKGPDLFRHHCAPCHGEDGKGGGPMAAALKAKVPDLTMLAKRNKGKFPTERVRKVIVGEEALASHGSREMPVWGPIFHQVEWDQDLGNVRVENLVKHLESIQQK